MAERSPVDIVMMLKAGGTAIEAESQSAVDGETGWTDDFTAGKYFEIEDFDFGINVVDSDSPETKGTGKEEAGRSKPKSGRFSKWVQGLTVATGQGAGGTLYPVEMEPFSFTRQIDSASPLLFKNCFKTIPFDSGAVVMRKAGGLGATSDGTGLAFLRIDFTSVLFVAIDWDAGEVVKEKCKFVCRSVKVKYPDAKVRRQRRQVVLHRTAGSEEGE